MSEGEIAGYIQYEQEKNNSIVRVPFFYGDNTVGRDKSNKVAIKRQSVSGFHAKLIATHSSLKIIDIGGRHGISYGPQGPKLAPHTELDIYNENILYIGGVKCKIQRVPIIEHPEETLPVAIQPPEEKTNLNIENMLYQFGDDDPEIKLHHKDNNPPKINHNTNAIPNSKQEIDQFSIGDLDVKDKKAFNKSKKEKETKKVSKFHKDEKKQIQVESKKIEQNPKNKNKQPLDKTIPLKQQKSLQINHEQKQDKHTNKDRRNIKKQNQEEERKVQNVPSVDKNQKKSKEKEEAKKKDKQKQKQRERERERQEQMARQKRQQQLNKEREEQKRKEREKEKEREERKKRQKQQQQKKQKEQKLKNIQRSKSKQHKRHSKDKQTDAEADNLNSSRRVLRSSIEKQKQEKQALQGQGTKQRISNNRKRFPPDTLSVNEQLYPKRRSFVNKRVLISGFIPDLTRKYFCIVDNIEDEFDYLVMKEYKRTFKALYAICRGIQILRYDWIKESEFLEKTLKPEGYIFKDIDYIYHSISKVNDGHRVFKGLHFYLGSEQYHLNIQDIEALIYAGGGELMKKIGKLSPKEKESKNKIAIIRNFEQKTSQIYEEELKKIKKLGFEDVYAIEMILDSCEKQQINWKRNVATSK